MTLKDKEVTSLLPQFNHSVHTSDQYTATAVASGPDGWNGTVSSEGMDFQFALPSHMGGTGVGVNPEQMFAVGYSACLLGSIQHIAKKQGKYELTKDAKVVAKVSIGKAEGMSGWGIGVEVEVEGLKGKGMEDSEAEALLKAGSEFCPYSRLLKHGAVVTSKCI
ncbi:hypothetical protein D9758_005839 [Tetrapyrgos nigripes]|uniref:Uncharacterized protein n=1 Tax=Tetrapyrgos nigripes TaxID=182062 RepID=A0A8H5G2U8_9AGAR|nr:hypothetical protein D9758_005839 [Tetrapyrgos nigripes]